MRLVLPSAYTERERECSRHIAQPGYLQSGEER